MKFQARIFNFKQNLLKLFQLEDEVPHLTPFMAHLSPMRLHLCPLTGPHLCHLMVLLPMTTTSCPLMDSDDEPEPPTWCPFTFQELKELTTFTIRETNLGGHILEQIRFTTTLHSSYLLPPIIIIIIYSRFCYHIMICNIA